ncbi:MAG: DUF2249 domain-containing protein [Paenibacillus sp.]|jgi:uncharacterized protein (DUF2249 family)|uniref:DUF2249 domain-containing protein n=1 Tax=Paenibacillus sp. TaxID=58172 RepID=UPI00208097CE|nr:DUF2249 domain-containing protein [Paenibacillus sp.]MDU2242090.1 DUF2249 domain-containing protein [Paenibacillus sp.]GJM82564.1 hypothetical protein HMSSN139_50600 [Paenibacillus sp. HMSSN-139]
MNREDAKLVELDVREQLRNKLEPFQLIMDTVKTLGKDDIFVLHATFKPTPLLGFLKMKGLVGKSTQHGKEHWITTFVHKKNKTWLEQVDTATAVPETPDASDEPAFSTNIIQLDNRGLEPPNPMVRTLAALDRCKPGDEVHIHNDRVPVFLIEELNSLGCTYTVEEQPDGTAKVQIRKP